MAHEPLPEDQLECWMGPFIAHLNGLALTQVRSMCGKPLSCDADVRVTYLAEESSPFGYEYVEFEVQKAGVFNTHLRLEGTPGTISTVAYLPVVEIHSGKAAFRSWLSDTIRARANR